MAMSSGKNFGGGDTDWEEKRGTKYATSESRLIDILDNICGNDFGCAQILEEYEDTIEDWFFNQKHDNKEKKVDDIYKNPFYQFMCVKELKFCCSDDKSYGSKCNKCPGYNKESSTVCNDHGTCEGAGDRKGTGKCKCTSNYKGKTCNECKARFYKNENNECKTCHQGCKNSCSGPTNVDCEGKNEKEICGKGFELEIDGDVRRCNDVKFFGVCWDALQIPALLLNKA